MASTFCSYFDQGQCRSCEFLELDYPSQLKAKEERLQKALGFFPVLELEKTVGSELQGFRNRAKMSVTGTLENPIIGLVGERSLDAGRELLRCPIHHARINELLARMPAWIRDSGLEPYRILERQGELKGLILFYSPESDQMYLRFVVRSREGLPRLKRALPELQRECPWLVCISANLQPIPHAFLEGPEEVILSEKKNIELKLGPVSLQLSPQAFVQTNLEVATQLYQVAAQWIASLRPARMLELFCGQGAFSFFAAGSAERILGIEINADAVRMATETARARGLTHLSFSSADATGVDREMREFKPDLVLVNPPRKGLGKGVSLLLRNPPEHLIYSSCDAATLADDLLELSRYYPTVKRAKIFDMFPHTSHFETLVWLKRDLKSR